MKKILLLLMATLIFCLSACDQSKVVAVSSANIQGVAAKGPYQVGSTVNAYSLVAGVRSAQPVATGEVTDNVGNYSITIPDTAAAPFEIEVAGNYIDETTGQVTTTTQPTSIVIANASAVPAKLSVNPAASIQAALVKAALVANPNANIAEELKASGKLALQALNIPTTDAAGNDIDPASLDILDPNTDPAVAAAAINASAIVAQLANTGTDTAAFAAAVAKDVQQGKPVGSNLVGGTTTFTTAAAAVPTNVVSNLTNGITAAGGTAPVIATTDTAVATQTTAATTVQKLTGFALASNTVTISGQTATVAATGAVSTVGNVSAAAVIIDATLKDYGTGTGPLARTVNPNFSFDIKDVNSTRYINGTISPVKIVADGAGGATVTVLAGATLTWRGMTSAGTGLSGKVTNVKFNPIFTSTSTGNFSIDANALLKIIQKKVNNPALNILSLPGTYDYTFAMGTNFGHEAAAAGIDQFFPTSDKVPGRAIHGRISDQAVPSPANNSGVVVTTLAGSGSYGAVDGSATAASFNRPYGIAMDQSGNVYVADSFNHTIRKISPAGLVTTLAGSGAAGAVDGTGTAASLNVPSGIAVDTSGNIFVADTFNNIIRKISPAGNVTTLAGSGAVGALDGAGTSATFSFPQGIAVDASGNVYVADTSNHTIRKISPVGVVSTLAGSGVIGAVDATGIAASFNTPRGIAVDASGNVYVADTSNYTIRKISSGGVVTTLAGSGGSGAVDGTGTAASFRSPSGIAVDASGNVYVADTYNSIIRKISPAGVVTTLAGSGGSGAVDGTGTAASFNAPLGIAVDASGNILVADSFNHTIRKISPASVTAPPPTATMTAVSIANNGNATVQSSVLAPPTWCATCLQ